MVEKLNILFVEDIRSDAELIWHEIEKNGIHFSKLLVSNRSDYTEALTTFKPDLIISDYSLPQMDGMTALILRNEIAPLIPFILVTGSINEEVAVDCIKAGADDYILKENLSRLAPAIINSCNKLKLVSDRKKAEEALAFNNLLLRTQQEASIDGILVVDENDEILNFNHRFIEIWGIPENIIESRADEPVLKFVTGKIVNPEEFVMKVKYLYEFRDEISQDEVLLKDGRTIDRYSAPMFGPDKKYYGRVWYFRDITERKESEQELISAKEKAEESDRLKTAFLHNISHEIRTPMNAIVGFSALLSEPDADPEVRNSYIEVIIQSSNHLLAIITDIVDISNIEANLIKSTKNEVNINSLIKSLSNQFVPKAEAKKIDLIFEHGLSDQDALILTDNTKLSQILSNLLSNAFKFTDKGNIKIGYNVKGNFLEFSVSDTGIGISPVHQGKIFDRFYQVQNTISRLYEGTGLGLSISKAYVELLGGRIWLTSDPGRGTTFFFTIPYEKAVIERKPENEKKTSASLVFREKKVILVAEDVESNFKLIKYYLSESNVEVLHAFDGREAVEKCFSGQNIDLILMDIKMPVMDGYTATKLIREKNTRIPIIAQTAYADDMEKAIECGCSALISKPFDKKALYKVLSEFI